MIQIFDLSIDSKINQLSDGHSFVDTHRMGTRDFKRPRIAKSDISFTGCSMDIDSQPADTTLAFQKRYSTMSFSILHRHPQIQGIWMKYKPFLRNLKMLHFIMFSRIEDVIFIIS